MKSYTVTGWGINANCLNKVSVPNKINFIKKHLPAIYQEMINDRSDPNTNIGNIFDFFKYCDTWIDEYVDEHGDIGFAILFTKAINENEDGFYVTYIDTGHESAIIYEIKFPWEMSERVKKMTADDMTAVFKKYLDEIEVSTTVARKLIECYG